MPIEPILSCLRTELQTDAGVSISRVSVSDAHWNTGDTRFLANVREDAVPV